MEDTCQHSSSLQHEVFQEKAFQKYPIRTLEMLEF